MARQAARVVEVEGLLRAVAGQVLRPFDAQPPENLSVLALGWKLLNAEAGKGEAERLGEVCLNRGSHEVGELWERPRGVEGMRVERGPQIVERLDSRPVPISDLDPAGGE